MAWSERLDFSGQTLSLWSARLDFEGETLGPGIVTLVAPLAEAGQRITAIPDLAGGDILEWHNVVGGTDSDVIVYTDGTFECSRAVTAFDVRSYTVSAPSFSAQAGFSVTGDFVDGGTVTITKAGGGFGATGPTIALYDDYSNRSLGASPALAASDVGAWDSINGEILADANFRQGRAATIIENGSSARSRFIFAPASEWLATLYIRLPETNELAFTSSPTQQGMKLLWLYYSSDGFSSSTDPDLWWPAWGNFADGIVWTEQGIRSNKSPLSGQSLYSGQWGSGLHSTADITAAYNGLLRLTLYMKHTGPGNFGEGWAKSWRADTGQVANASWAGEDVLGTTVTNQQWDRWDVGAFTQTMAGNAFRVLAQEIYVAAGAGAQAQILVTDAATIESSRILSYCIPSSWADGEISAVLKQGQHGSLSGRHLHVVDAQGSAMYVGTAA